MLIGKRGNCQVTSFHSYKYKYAAISDDHPFVIPN